MRGAPRNPEIRLHAAFALSAQGARAAAEAELQEAIKLRPALEKQADVQELQAKLAGTEISGKALQHKNAKPARRATS